MRLVASPVSIRHGGGSALQSLVALGVLASVADGFLPLIQLPGARGLSRPDIATRSGAWCLGAPQLGAARAPRQGAAVGLRASASESSDGGQREAWDLLSEDTHKMLAKLGITELSPVQAASIPPIADGRDVSGAAGFLLERCQTFELAPTTWQSVEARLPNTRLEIITWLRLLKHVGSDC